MQQVGEKPMKLQPVLYVLMQQLVQQTSIHTVGTVQLHLWPRQSASPVPEMCDPFHSLTSDCFVLLPWEHAAHGSSMANFLRAFIFFFTQLENQRKAKTTPDEVVSNQCAVAFWCWTCSMTPNVAPSLNQRKKWKQAKPGKCNFYFFFFHFWLKKCWKVGGWLWIGIVPAGAPEAERSTRHKGACIFKLRPIFQLRFSIIQRSDDSPCRRARPSSDRE